jgi:hypothetical protein
MQSSQDRQSDLSGPKGVVYSSSSSAGKPAPSLRRWEFMSIIVWDDDSKSLVTSDLEDVEVLNTLGSEGWELVCVVPLARTQVLEMAYPGNTRKLLAYLKRPLA